MTTEPNRTEADRTVMCSNKLYDALIKAQGEMTPVAKDRENPYFKSNYATLKAITDMLRPILFKHGLGYVQGVEKKDGDLWMVTTIIHAESGGRIDSAVPFSCVDKKPQSLGGAITYMKRYGLQCAFGVVVAEDETDDDGNRASGIRVPKSGEVTSSDF